MANHNWQSTTLWKRLLENGSPSRNAVKTLLESEMDVIETVLAKGGTSPNDFTLHDDGHAFRVAELMAALIPEHVLGSLSAYELGLLLLSAYLHDIGMTPQQSKVVLHRQYLLTGNRQGISKEEIKDFDLWLAKHAEGWPDAFCPDPFVCEHLITHYSRHKHNDWSEEWIIQRFDDRARLGRYEDWVRDLVVLCRSHHDDYETLLGRRFDPKLVDTPSVIVHLRFLACVLRVADILDFDPDRTPDILLRHRMVSPGSLLYWLKDRHVSMRIENGRVIFFATSPNARIHRALETMAWDIEKELRLVDRVNRERPFKYTPLSDNSAYEWGLSPYFTPSILPKDGAYEYINGAFRPDSEKILKLLSGTKLYGDPLAAVRELLQNAFDAVREQIARERLNSASPGSAELAALYAKTNRVVLHVSDSPDGVKLTCRDTGVGLTKELIESHLLVSGSSWSPELMVLDQECKHHGFALERTGEFGVGLLSYFILADRVVFHTRRSLLAGSNENTGWVFDTEGLGAFGELRREKRSTHGTEVELYLKPDVVGPSFQKFYSRLRDYVVRQLRHVPCIVMLSASDPECGSVELEPGWTAEPKLWAQSTLPFDIIKGQPQSEAVLPQKRRREIESNRQALKNTLEDAVARRRYFVVEDMLPGNMGRFRVHIPYFELPAGKCLAYLLQTETEVGLEIRNLPYYRGMQGVWPSGRFYESWKGVTVSGPGTATFHSTIVEVDWLDSRAGEISISRDELHRSLGAKESLDWLRGYIADAVRSILDQHRNSPFDSLSRRMVDGTLANRSPISWLKSVCSSGSRHIFLAEVETPAVGMSGLRVGAYEWNGKPVGYYVPVELKSKEPTYFVRRDWYDIDFPPDRLVLLEDAKEFAVTGLWTNLNREPYCHDSDFPTATFPPAWSCLVGANVGGQDYWNPSHPLLLAADRPSWDWVEDQVELQNRRDPLAFKQELLGDTGKAAAWLLYVLSWGSEENEEMWNALVERDATFLPCLFGTIFGSVLAEPIQQLMFWRGRYTDYYDDKVTPELYVVTPRQWTTVPGTSHKVHDYLPKPDVEWRLRRS